MSSTKVNRPILSNVHSFFTFMTTLYDLSTTIYQVLSSCTWHLFTLFKKENNQYTTLGWSSYQCDPTFGLLIIFVFVKPDYRNEGIGTAILQSLQLFCSKNTGKMQTLIWFTKRKQS